MTENPKPRGRIRRYGFELLIVFMGVWLSLLAESWRQSAMERRDEQTSLSRIARDMEVDISDITGNLSRADTGLVGGKWVLNHRHAGAPQETELAEKLAMMGPCSQPVWNASEYTALKGSGRLNLISDEELRQDVVKLYENRAFLDWVHELDCEESEEVLDLMSPYVEFGFSIEFLRDGPDTVGWNALRHPTVEAVPERERLMTDRLLMNRIAKLVSTRQFLKMQMEDEMTRTVDLREAILESAGG